MKNQLTKHLLIALAIAVCVFAPIAGFAQDTLSLATPGDYVAPENTNALTVAVTIILGYLSGMIPGLKKIPNNFLRTGITAFVVLCIIGAFKLGAVTPEVLQYVIVSFLPNFAFSGLTYEALKAIFKAFNIDLGTPKPALPAKS